MDAVQATGQTFQRLMNYVLQGLPFVFVYLDDILVASQSHADHELHLRQVSEHFQQHSLNVCFNKCSFGLAEIPFIGHLMSKEASNHSHPRSKQLSTTRNLPPAENSAAFWAS